MEHKDKLSENGDPKLLKRKAWPGWRTPTVAHCGVGCAGRTTSSQLDAPEEGCSTYPGSMRGQLSADTAFLQAEDVDIGAVKDDSQDKGSLIPC